MQRLQLDYETLRDINPRLVYCSISGYGQTGVRSSLSGHDLNYIATAGALSLFGDRDGQPIVPYNLIADYAGGTLHAVIGILSSLTAREHTGTGQFVDVSMTDGVLGLLSLAVADYMTTGKAPKAGTSKLTGGVSYYNTYTTKDHRAITVGCNEPWLYRNLCEAMGLGELSDMQTADDEGQRYLFGKFADRFREHTLAEWEAAFQGHDIAYAPARGVDEILDDQDFRARGMIIEVPDEDGQPVLQVGSSVRLSATPASVRTLAPLPGQHTDGILAALGYTTAEIGLLREEGAV